MILTSCMAVLGVMVCPFFIREFVKGWKQASAEKVKREALATKEIGEDDILEFPSPLMPIKVFFPVMVIEQEQQRC